MPEAPKSPEQIAREAAMEARITGKYCAVNGHGGADSEGNNEGSNFSYDGKRKFCNVCGALVNA